MGLLHKGDKIRCYCQDGVANLQAGPGDLPTLELVSRREEIVHLQKKWLFGRVRSVAFITPPFRGPADSLLRQAASQNFQVFPKSELAVLGVHGV